MFLLGHKIAVKLSTVYQHFISFNSKLLSLFLIHSYSLLVSPQSLALSKQLIRQMEKEKLHAVNDAEVDRLKECWLSDKCLQAVMSFFKAKDKLQS